MKRSALIVAVALACGGAYAAQNAADDHGATHAKGGSLMDKTKNVFRRAGDKVRHAGNSIARKVDKNHKDDQVATSNTRTMGAPASDMDSARRQRMDDAYANYKSRQK